MSYIPYDDSGDLHVIRKVTLNGEEHAFVIYHAGAIMNVSYLYFGLCPTSKLERTECLFTAELNCQNMSKSFEDRWATFIQRVKNGLERITVNDELVPKTEIEKAWDLIQDMAFKIKDFVLEE